MSNEPRKQPILNLVECQDEFPLTIDDKEIIIKPLKTLSSPNPIDAYCYASKRWKGTVKLVQLKIRDQNVSREHIVLMKEYMTFKNFRKALNQIKEHIRSETFSHPNIASYSLF